MRTLQHWQRIAAATLVLLGALYILLPDTFDRPGILLLSAFWMLALGLWGAATVLRQLFRR